MNNRRISFVGILYLFFIIMISVPTFWLITGGDFAERSIIEGRKLVHFSLFDRGYYSALTDLINGNPKSLTDVLDKQFLQKSFQKDFDAASSDQFPLRELWIQLSAWLDRQTINIAYLFSSDPAIPTGIGSDILIMRDKSRFIISPKEFNDSLKITIDDRIKNYDYLIQMYPEITFYAFYFERLEYSSYNPMSPYYVDADRGRAFQYFEQNLPEDLRLGKWLLTSYEDFDSNYYSTDHHWNIHGDIKAYKLVHNLLKTGFPEISAPIEFQDFYTFPGIDYRGTTARLSLYPIDGENFEVVLYGLPPYKTYEAGKEIQRNHSTEYLNGDFVPNERYTDHFVQYFGHVSPFIEYVFDSNSDRNLLLIGKSFNIPIEPMIASHYHQHDIRIFRREMLLSLLYDPTLKCGEARKLLPKTFLVNPEISK